MRTWLSYLHYKIYKWYISKGENDVPLIYAYLVCTLLVGLNIQSITSLVILIIDYDPFSTKTLTDKIIYALIFVAPPALFNYFMVFHSGAWKESFNWFQMYPEKYKKWDLSLWIFAIVTIIITIATIAIGRHFYIPAN